MIKSLVEIVGRGIDCLACDLDGLEARLLSLRLEPKRRDHLRRLAGQNFRRKHVGEREPLRLVGAEIVEADVEGVAARILRSDREEVALRSDLHQCGQIVPAVLRAKLLHQTRRAVWRATP